MTCGVYRIENLLDGKLYIGSSINVEARFRKHLATLNRGEHQNAHLQRAFDRDGVDSFCLELVESCTADDLEAREQFYIDKYRVPELGYNIAPRAYSNKGVRHTEEEIEKMREASTGRKFSAIHKERIATALRQHIRAPEHSLNISLAKKGKPSSFKGKRHPESARQKIREHALRQHRQRNEKGQFVGYDVDQAAI